jgi:hypothetical protein
MPGGYPWSAHELNVADDAEGQKECRETYGPLRSFQSIAKEKTVPLLIDRLSSTDETKAHICPYQVATEGELAVYVLAIITQRPWFLALSLSEAPDNAQKTIREALGTKEGRTRIAEYYRRMDSNRMAGD